MSLSYRPREFMEERIMLTLSCLVLVKACPFLSRPYNRAGSPGSVFICIRETVALTCTNMYARTHVLKVPKVTPLHGLFISHSGEAYRGVVS